VAVDMHPDTIHPGSHGPFKAVVTFGGGCTAGDFLLEKTVLEGGIPLTLERTKSPDTVVFQGQREILVRYLLSMDPARWVGGYHLRFTLFLDDGTPVRAIMDVLLKDPAPKILALDRDSVVPKGQFHLITQHAHGKVTAHARVSSGTDLLLKIIATSEEGMYPGIGEVEVLRLEAPDFLGWVLLSLDVHGERTNARPIEVTPARFSGPPRIFLVLPSSGLPGMPIGIGGTNFDVGTIPYVNDVPSVSLSNFRYSNLPLIGPIAVGFTIIPPAAPFGNGVLTVEYLCKGSNPFPFTVQ
jgi:hypothetical protein